MAAKNRERVKPGLYRRTNADDTTTWEIAYRDSDGKQRSETVGPRQRDAEARLAQVKADMSRGQRVAPRPRLTFREAAETWYASTGHLRHTTRAAYRASLDVHLLPTFGRRRLDAITPDDVSRWAQRATTLAYRHECDARRDPAGRERKRPATPYRARTLNLALTTAQRVYSHAIRRQGHAGTSPVVALERDERPSDDPKPITILTPEQVAAVIAAADDPYRPALAFLAGTGARIGEALGLTWGALDLGTGTVEIAAQLDRDGRRAPLKTRKSRRTLDLPRALVRALAAHKLASADTGDDALVFVSTTGTPLNWRNLARRGLVAACKRAGVPVISPHGLRHAHASALLADGWDLAAVSARLGHANVSITATTYSHLIEDEARRAERRTSLDGLYDDGQADEPPTLAVVS